MIGLVQVGEQAMADRYAYIPFLGLFVMVDLAGCRLGCRKSLDQSPLAGLPSRAVSCLLALASLHLTAKLATCTIRRRSGSCALALN